MFCLHYFRVFTRCRFQNVPIRFPFSKSTIFKICRQKMCLFCVNGWPIRGIFHCLQNMPASYEHSLSASLVLNLVSRNNVSLFDWLYVHNQLTEFQKLCLSNCRKAKLYSRMLVVVLRRFFHVKKKIDKPAQIQFLETNN